VQKVNQNGPEGDKECKQNDTYTQYSEHLTAAEAMVLLNG